MARNYKLKSADLENIGKMLYGPEWQTPLARFVGRPPRRVREWVAKEPRPIPDWVKVRLIEAAKERVAEIRLQEAQLLDLLQLLYSITPPELALHKALTQPREVT